MLKAKTKKSLISRCPLINCSYRNFRLDNLKNHLKSRKHKITNADVINKILGTVKSNSLPTDYLLRVQNDNVVQVRLPQQEIPSSASSVQNQNAASATNSTGSTLQYENPITCEDVLGSEHNQHEIEPSQSAVATSTESLNEHMHNLTEAVVSLNLTIQKISINERDMKTVLQQTKTVLENKLSEMDQRLEKADNIVSNVNNTLQSLVQLQMTYSWLQLKLQQSPSPPSGACSLCQRHHMQIQQHQGFSSVQNWVDCSVVLDSDHRVQKITSHEKSQCHAICASAEKQTKRNTIPSSLLVNQKKENEVTQRFLLRCYGLIQCHVAYNKYSFMSYLHHLQGVEVGNRHLTDMITVNNCLINRAPESIKKLISLCKSKYDLRGDVLSIPKVNTTKKGLKSWRYFAPRQWNNLDNSIRSQAGTTDFVGIICNETFEHSI